MHKCKFLVENQKNHQTISLQSDDSFMTAFQTPAGYLFTFTSYFILQALQAPGVFHTHPAFHRFS